MLFSAENSNGSNCFTSAAASTATVLGELLVKVKAPLRNRSAQTDEVAELPSEHLDVDPLC